MRAPQQPFSVMAVRSAAREANGADVNSLSALAAPLPPTAHAIVCTWGYPRKEGRYLAGLPRVPRRGVNMATAALLSILTVGFDQSPPHPPPSHPPLAPTAPGCEGGCFFISEYVEPADSSQDGFLELYNGCEQRVNLRDYSLLLCRDGCDSAEGMAGSDGIPSGALPVSLSTTDSYINPGSLFSIVYCVEVHTSKCANHNLISLASSFFGDLGDGNGA